MAMSTCTNCGRPVAATTQFCAGCGQPVGAAAPTGASTAYGAPGSPAMPSPGYATPGSSPIPGVPGGASPTSGFFKALFDSSFAHLVTPSLLRVFWIIFLVVWSAYAALWFIVGLVAMADSPVMILFSLIVVPIIYLMGIIFYRIAFEFIAAFFRMADDIRDLRGSGRM